MKKSIQKEERISNFQSQLNQLFILENLMNHIFLSNSNSNLNTSDEFIKIVFKELNLTSKELYELFIQTISELNEQTKEKIDLSEIPLNLIEESIPEFINKIKSQQQKKNINMQIKFVFENLVK